jgi:multiple sugar transport system ATP-binding protein
MSYLSLSAVSKRFKDDIVLDRASLEIDRGETVVVFGPSGCGKTVLLRLIAGINEPDSGHIRMGNRDVTYLEPEHRNIGMAFQNFALYPHLSAFDNIASPLKARGMRGAEIEGRVKEVADLLKIGHVLHHLPKALSNGQKQRTSLGRALAANPGLLLLDDPLRNVDAKLRYEMRIELPRVLKAFETTVIYVTQDYKEAMALGDRVAVLMGGGFKQIDHPSVIYKDPDDLDVARLFGDPTVNVIDGRIADGAVELLGLRFPLRGQFEPGPCRVALRPESIEVTLDDTAAGATAIDVGDSERHGLEVELDAVTPLNVRAVMLLKTADGRELLATCSEDEASRLPRGHKQVTAHIRASDLLFFTPSGARLRPRPSRGA